MPNSLRSLSPLVLYRHIDILRTDWDSASGNSGEIRFQVRVDASADLADSSTLDIATALALMTLAINFVGHLAICIALADGKLCQNSRICVGSQHFSLSGISVDGRLFRDPNCSLRASFLWTWRQTFA